MGIRSFFQKQISEIAASRTLTLFGIFLALTHVVTTVYWFNRVPEILADAQPICWPFWHSCYVTHFISGTFVRLILLCYGTIGGGAAYLFLKRAIPPAYWLLIGLTILKFAIMLQDYRLMGNFHYMPFLASLVFFVVSDKTWSLKLLIAIFYFTAGTLKLNLEWLSGAAVGLPPSFVPLLWHEIACAWVVFLELLVVWGLWNQSHKVRWLVLSQLVLFHLVSWYWVGYFYPSIMFCLLSIFVLDWQSAAPRPFLSKRWPRSCVLFFGLYLIMQLIPRFAMTDSALDGHWRLTSLNMFDARSTCLPSVMLKFRDHFVDFVPKLNLGIRIQCDPIVYDSVARNLCRENLDNREFQDLDLHLVAKRTTDQVFQDIRSISDFCAHEGFKLLGRGKP